MRQRRAKEFLFDVKMFASIRVKATSEREARRMLGEALDCADSNLGSWPNGDPILCEMSRDGAADLVETTELEGVRRGHSSAGPRKAAAKR